MKPWPILDNTTWARKSKRGACRCAITLHELPVVTGRAKARKQRFPSWLRLQASAIHSEHLMLPRKARMRVDLFLLGEAHSITNPLRVWSRSEQQMRDSKYGGDKLPYTQFWLCEYDLYELEGFTQTGNCAQKRCRCPEDSLTRALPLCLNKIHLRVSCIRTKECKIQAVSHKLLTAIHNRPGRR